MIPVSEEYKTAIKKPERKIKGYVEILYDLPDITITATTNITTTHTSASEIIDGVRVENLYGSLDYLPLDGSYLTMSSYNSNTGLISDNLYKDMQIPVITLSFSSSTIKGITLYFRENPPTNMTLSYSDGTSQTVENEDNTVQIIFDEAKTLTSVQITINSMMYDDRKIYLMEVDLGITQVYKDQDLIEFTVDEEVNKLVEEVPINETNIILNNMSRLFDPLNPSGIVPYLSENSLIKPYAGVFTENSGYYYIKMGEFYFDSYTNNSDDTTTLVGKNIINRLNKELLKDDNETDFLQTSMSENDFRSLMSNYNYEIKSLNWTHNIPSYFVKDNSLMKFLSEMTFGQWNIMYADRDNKLNFKAIDTSKKGSLTKTELINDVDYKSIDKINTVRLISTKIGSGYSIDSRDVLTTNVVLSKSPEIFLVQTSEPLLALTSVSQTGGTSASFVSQGWYMAFVKVTGTVGNTVTLKFNTNQAVKTYIETTEMKSDASRENVLEFDSFMNYYPQAYIDISDILNKVPSYEMSFEYNGDPSLEAGDYINVETPYGYKKIFIQKNIIKYDGGLSGTIEGVE